MPQSGGHCPRRSRDCQLSNAPEPLPDAVCERVCTALVILCTFVPFPLIFGPLIFGQRWARSPPAQCTATSRGRGFFSFKLLSRADALHCTCLSFFQLTPACKSAISDLSRTFCGSKLVAREGKRGLKSQKMAPQVGLESTLKRKYNTLQGHGWHRRL